MSRTPSQAPSSTKPNPVRRIRELPLNEQPIHRLQRHGARALSNAELLEIISGARTTDTGRQLLAHFDGLGGLDRASLHDHTGFETFDLAGAASRGDRFERT